MNAPDSSLLTLARSVLAAECAAIERISARLDESFEAAVGILLACEGRIVVCGMGKSGIIGRKIAATLASTGAPSFWLHPAEALHGDLGMLARGDVVLSISNSGETDELLRLVPHFRALDIAQLTLVGNLDSTLARHADCALDVSVEREADVLDLAPTSSTTAALALGDALAVALMHQRGFRPEQFASLHPGGSLGRKLLTTVAQVMRTERLPVVDRDAPAREVVHVVSAGRLGLAVVTEREKICGIITDGDLRRAMERDEAQFFHRTARDLMTPDPVSIAPDARLTEAEALLRKRKITSLLVGEAGRLAGIVQIYDLS